MAKRTIGTPSVSGPSGPSKAAPSVEYSQSVLGKVTTINDGNTPVSESGWRGMDEPEGSDKPCINTSCRSYGKIHPNCRCYAGPGGTSLEFAKGGQVCLGVHMDKCEHFADGGQVAENMMMHSNPGDTLDHVAVHHGLLGLLTKTGFSKSQDHNKSTEDYIDHSRRGHKTFHGHMEGLFSSNRIEPDKGSREALKSHLQDLREHPEKLLDVGGNVNLPDHQVKLAEKAGNAFNHFNALKPVETKKRPLDESMPVGKREQAIYDRHIDIANHPHIILNHIKDGTLLPSDLSTLKALYPDLQKSMVEKAGEALISAKSKNMEIPYKQKQSLSLLMGQPMDSTMTPGAMQVIIKSQGAQQVQNQAKKQPKKASGTELSQINKVNAMDATASQDRLMDKAKH